MPDNYYFFESRELVLARQLAADRLNGVPAELIAMKFRLFTEDWADL